MKNAYLTILLFLCTYCAFAVGPITGPTTICVGTAVTFSDTTSGGTWVCWGDATIDSFTGILTATSRGFISVEHRVGGSSAWIDIEAFDPVINGSSAVCVGSVTVLSDPNWETGASWSGFGGSIAFTDSSQNEIEITGVAAGTALITLSNSTGCVAVRTVNVTPASCSGVPNGGIAAVLSGSLCPGSLALLSLSGHTVCGTVLQWQVSLDGTTWANVAGAVTSTGKFYPSTSSYYRCKVTCVSSGLAAYSSTVYFSVHSSVFSVPLDGVYGSCGPSYFSLGASCVSLTKNVTTFFGDGTSGNNIVATYNVILSHDYSLPGTYTMKHLLYVDSILQDSFSYFYVKQPCGLFSIRLSSDVNGNCAHDSSDYINSGTVTVRIDSSGVTIDTVTITSGLYYQPLGPPGTVYKFTVLPLYGGVAVCPSFILDTVQSGPAVYPAKYFSIQCSSSVFDLFCYQGLGGNPTRQFGRIIAGNNYCPFTGATVTLTHSNKYVFIYSTPAPSSIAGNVVSWNYSALSSADGSKTIWYSLAVPGSPLTLGDTVNTSVSITPVTGDANPPNNFVSRCDTVRASWDPNDITVFPEGDIPNNTTLEYTVRFENTGNDTAHNIYVLDTLPNNVDPHTLDIVFASAPMYLTVTNVGGYNIAKFDFPNINLLDSSHHGLCDGMFVFKIKTRPGLADGAPIPNRVGIYFDANAVVLTNTASNTILIPSVSITAIGGSAICSGAPATITATAHSFNPVHYRWYVNGVIAGTDNAAFTSTSLNNGDMVACRVVNASGDSVIATSKS